MSSCLCAANPSHPEQRQQLKDTQKQSQFTSVRKHKTFKQSSSNLGEVPRQPLFALGPSLAALKVVSHTTHLTQNAFCTYILGKREAVTNTLRAFCFYIR